jgi:predicted nucleic acid-binding protein
VSLVLDASVPLGWFLGESTVDAVHAIAERMRREVAFVTQLWPLEIANVLTIAVRKDKLTTRARASAFDSLRSMVIEIDQETAGYTWTRTVSLADRHKLTMYDAGYLDLRCGSTCLSPLSVRPWPTPRAPKASKFCSNAASASSGRSGRERRR